MASGNRNYYRQAHNEIGGRSTPSRVTQIQASHNPRYSYQDSPPERLSTFQSVPPVSPIDEDPMSSPRTHIQYAERPSLPSDKYPPEKAASQLDGPRSPYGFQPPEQVHPAYFAPIAHDVPSQPSQPLQIPASTSSYRAEDPLPVKDPDVSTAKKSDPVQYSQGKTIRSEVPQFDAPPQRSATERAQIYNPDSFAGPNGAPVEKHMPGQLVHPNSQTEPHWKNGLCEPDATCCFSLFCPCVIYGKTQYRLSKKTNRQDPTDLLGYEKVNGSCGIMALGCGFQCKIFLL